MKNLNNNIVWSLLSQFSNFGLSLIFTIFLARIISPGEYGIIDQAGTVTAFFILFADGGIVWAIVQRKRILDREVSNLFWVNMCIGALFSIICWVIAPHVGDFYSSPMVTEIFPVLGLIFILTGINTPYKMWMKRELAFKKLTIIGLIAGLLTGSVALYAALNGLGVWALVLQALMRPFVEMLLLMSFVKMPLYLYSFQTSIRSLLKFGSGLIGFGLINYLARNLDNVLIGKYLGAEELAFYAKAYFLMFVPTVLITGALSGLIVSELSKVQDDLELFQKLYANVLRMIVTVTLPLTGYYLLFPEDLIMLLYGTQWQGSVVLLQLLGLAAITQPLYNTMGWIYTAIGKSKEMFYWGIISSVLLSVSFIIGVQWGAKGVALAYSAVMGLCLLPVGLFLPHKLAGIKLLRSVQPLMLVGVAGIIALLSAKLLSSQLLFESTLGNIVLRVSCLMVVYLGVLLVIYKKDIVSLVFIERGE